jgi:hypothetical protein
VVGGIVAFFVTGWIVFVLPVAILSLDLLESRWLGIIVEDSRSLNVYQIGTYSSYLLMTKVA